MSDHEFDGREFTDDERKQLRKLLEGERRMEWFWGSMKIWVGYAVAGVTGAYAVYLAFKEHFPWLFRKF